MAMVLLVVMMTTGLFDAPIAWVEQRVRAAGGVPTSYNADSTYLMKAARFVIVVDTVVDK
jgi:hypothetical protein